MRVLFLSVWFLFIELLILLIYWIFELIKIFIYDFEGESVMLIVKIIGGYWEYDFVIYY